MHTDLAVNIFCYCASGHTVSLLILSDRKNMGFNPSNKAAQIWNCMVSLKGTCQELFPNSVLQTVSPKFICTFLLMFCKYSVLWRWEHSAAMVQVLSGPSSPST